MALSEHLQRAADRIHLADRTLEEMREHPTTMASIRRWLEALTEHALASSELQQYQQELTMENLQALNRVLERPRGPDSAS